MQREEIKVLLVDDSSTILRALKNALTKFCNVSEGNIFTAENGEVGLSVVAEAQPHLIISDWNMPIMNGIEFITKVRQNDTKVTIVMLTTEGERSKVMQALKVGANDYIVKPFTQEIISKKIGQALDMALRRYS